MDLNKGRSNQIACRPKRMFKSPEIRQPNYTINAKMKKPKRFFKHLAVSGEAPVLGEKKQMYLEPQKTFLLVGKFGIYFWRVDFQKKTEVVLAN